MSIAISVSKLESFRKYLDEVKMRDKILVQQQDLIDEIMGKKIYKPAMGRGTAYHSLVEMNKDVTKLEAGYSVKIRDEEKPHFFTEEVAQPALQFRADHLHMIQEVNLHKDIQVREHTVRVRGRADVLEGMEGRDIKTSEHDLDIDFYMDSFQWRLYCWMEGLRAFHYEHFKLTLGENDQVEKVTYSHCSFAPLPFRDQEVRQLIYRFVEFAETHNLLSYLELKAA